MTQRTWVLKGSNATSQTTVATSAATGTDYPQVGDIVFVGVGHDNSGAAVPTLSSLAISGAGAVDSWRIKSQGTANVSTAAAAVQGDLAWGIVTTAFTSATVITATLSAAVTAKTIGVGAFIGAGLVSSSATAGTSGVTQMSANSGLGFTLGVAATEASTPLTTNTGTTLLTNTGGSGASAAQVSISMVYSENGGAITTAAPSDGGFSWFGFKTLITADLSGNAIPSGEAFGTPTIGGGSTPTTASPTAIGSGEAFGTPAASTPLTVSPTGISSAEGFGTPVVAIPIVASPSGIASAEAFGTPSITKNLTVSPTAIGSGEAFGTPTIPAAGMHNINPPGGTWWTTTFNDLQGGISVANAFYTTDSGWQLTGARVYFSSALISALGAGASVPVFVLGDNATIGVINGSAPLATASVTVPASAGWASATFSSPISMTANTRYWVGYHTTNEYQAYNTSNTGTLYQATDGSNLFMGRPSAQTTWDVSEFEYGASTYITAPSTSNFWWGIDVIAGIPSGGATTISPSGIASTEAFGTLTANKQLTVSPSAISTAEAFGTLSVTSILTAIAQGIASGESFGNPSISATISISPVGISSAEAFGTLSVSQTLTVSPTGGVSAEAFGTINVTLVLSVNPSGVPPGETFGTPVITVSGAGVTVSPTGIASAETFGTPTITQTIPVAPTGIGSGETFGTPIITAGGGPTTISPTGIASVEAFGTLTYSGTRTVSPTGIVTSGTFGTPVITSGGVVLSPTAISTAEAFGTPSITTTLIVSPTGIAGPGGVPFTTYIKNTYSPKLEWMMDETSGTVAADSSGNGKDGTITGSPTLGAAGIVNDGGTGILFDGANGKYIVGPLESSLSLNQWTVIAFAKTNSTVEQTLAQRSGTGNGRFQIKNSWGTADGKMYVQNDENLAFVATPASVADNTGRMLAFRQDATTLKIFQNGGTQLASVASTAAGTNVQNGTLYVGSSNSGLKVWNGTIDGFIVVAGALTTTQLDDIYAASQAAAASQFGTLTITQVLNVLANGIATAEAFGTPSVSTTLTSSPTGIASTEAFGTPALSFAVTYSPTGIASAESVSTPIITAGGIVLSPTSIVSAQAIGVPSITQSTPLSPTSIPSEEAFGTVVITKTLTVLPSGINSSLAFGTLTATISPDIRPTSITSAEAFGTVTIGGGVATTTGTAYTAGVGIEVGVYLTGHPQLIWPAPTPPVTQAALPDPTVAPTLTASDTGPGALPDGTYRYSYAAWRGTVAQCTAPSPTADISITVNDTVTLTYPTIPGADGYIVYREKIA